jgi:copper(I)-binding protein
MKNTAFNALISLGLVGLLIGCSPTNDGISISDEWVRATPSLEVGAAYMTLQSPHNTALVQVESPAADKVEIHSMTMDEGVMRMRMMDALPLPAGETVKLEPGGFHLMLFGLKQPLEAGTQVEFTLHFKDNAGEATTMKISSPVKAGSDDHSH